MPMEPLTLMNSVTRLHIGITRLPTTGPFGRDLTCRKWKSQGRSNVGFILLNAEVISKS
jgi:hypothetical protein